MGFLKKHAFTELEVGFLSGFSKMGFVENYGLTVNYYKQKCLLAVDVKPLT